MNEKAWPLLFQFVRSYKNHSTINGFVKWRFQDEILFQVDEEEFVQGTITGMNRYEDFGVKVWNVSALCHLPQRKLNKKEIFIHSLFEVDDPRTLHLAMTFYLKNKLKKEKIFLLAMRYGKYTMFKNMLKLFDVKEESLKLEGLPTFDRIDFYRIATMYDIKGLENPGKYKLQKRKYCHFK